MAAVITRNGLTHIGTDIGRRLFGNVAYIRFRGFVGFTATTVNVLLLLYTVVCFDFAGFTAEFITVMDSIGEIFAELICIFTGKKAVKRKFGH